MNDVETPPSAGWISDGRGEDENVDSGQWATNVSQHTGPSTPYELRNLADLHKFFLGQPTNMPDKRKLLSLYDVTTNSGKILYAVSDHDRAWPHVFSPRYRVLDYKDARNKTLAFSLHFLMKLKENKLQEDEDPETTSQANPGEEQEDPEAEVDLDIIDDDENWDDNGPDLPWAPKGIEVKLASEELVGTVAFDGPESFVVRLSNGDEVFRMELGEAAHRWRSAAFPMKFQLSRVESDAPIPAKETLRKLSMNSCWVPNFCVCCCGLWCPNSHNFAFHTAPETTAQERTLLIAAAVLLDLPQRAALRQEQWRRKYHKTKKK